MAVQLCFDSKRLDFKPLAEDDLDLAIELWTDPEVTQYVGGTYSKDELEEEHPIVMRRCCHGCIGIWTLTDRQNNEKIGTSVLLPMPVEQDDTDWDLVVGNELPDADIEVGYVLKKSAWGKGFATEACKRLLKFAFEESPIETIVASTDHENTASQKVLLKSGLRELGLIKSYGEMCPGFQITKEQWKEDMSVI